MISKRGELTTLWLQWIVWTKITVPNSHVILNCIINLGTIWNMCFLCILYMYDNDRNSLQTQDFPFWSERMIPWAANSAFFIQVCESVLVVANTLYSNLINRKYTLNSVIQSSECIVEKHTVCFSIECFKMLLLRKVWKLCTRIIILKNLKKKLSSEEITV